MLSQARSLLLETLETRLAPATLVNAKTVTFQDVAGNSATVSFNKPVLTAANVDTVLKFDAGLVNGDNNVAQRLEKVDLTGLIGGLALSISGADTNGNPTAVDVGFIDATDKDERSIIVSGDVGRVMAGDFNTRNQGLGKLIVGSLGVVASGTAQPGNLASDITGSLGRLTVVGDIRRASVFVMGRIGPVQIGGSLIGSDIDDSGRIQAEDSIGAISIGGNIEGGTASRTGTILAGGRIGAINVGANLLGGVGAFSGSILGAAISRMTVTGNIVGGDGASSGSVTTARIGRTIVGGALSGGDGTSSGYLYFERAASVAIGGNVTGDDGDFSGTINVRYLGKIALGANLVGGQGNYSGEILSTIMGNVSIVGSVTGGPGWESGSIFATNRIGRVTVGGDWTGASISAGFAAGPDGYFGNDDDIAFNDAKGKPIAGRIAGITVAGKVEGTLADGDQFAFQAARISALNINGQKIALIPGAKTDNQSLGSDFALIEK